MRRASTRVTLVLTEPVALPVVADAAPRPDQIQERPEPWLVDVDARMSASGPFVVASDAFQPPLPQPVQPPRRPWLRQMQIAALLAIIIGGAGLGLSIAYAIFSQPIASPAITAPHDPYN